MCTRLSDSNIELVEKFIYTNPITDFSPAISIIDTENGKKAYQQILKESPTAYIHFGSNSCGMTSYGFYKTKANQIYVIQAYIGDIRYYYSPETCGILS
jgi:hypothetical protein